MVMIVGRKRKRGKRACSIPVKRITKESIRIGKLLYPDRDYWKPKTREDCSRVGRPCPFVTCEFNLYLDVNPATGSIKFNFPDLEVWEMKESCVLDVAERGGITLEEVGEIVNLTRERVRQIQLSAIRSIKNSDLLDLLLDHYKDGDLPQLMAVMDTDIAGDDVEDSDFESIRASRNFLRGSPW